MEALGKRADSLDALLQQTVIASHADLLKQVVGVKALDASLAQVEDNVREIKAYMHALRTKIHVPYQQSQAYTSQTSNLHAAIRHVRATARFIQLVRRLQTQIPDDGSPDFALGALTLLDIERAVAGGDLQGIHIVDQGMETIVQPRRNRTVAQAEQMLQSGIRLRSQGDIASGLQILFNLGMLATAVAARVRQYVTDWKSTVHGRLDPKDISAYVRDHNARAKSIDGSDMVGITGVVLSRIEALVDDLLARGLELRVLERVLARKRDVLPRFDVSNFLSSLTTDISNSSNGVTPSFLDLVARELDNTSGTRVVAFWWREALSLLASEIDSACTESSVIRQMLTNSYPRVVQLFVPKIEQLQPLEMPLLWDRLLGKFETEYVSRAASRIEDAVTRCYPPPPPPGLIEAQEKRSSAGGGMATGSELITAVSVVPNRKLVAGVIRSMSTELEMAKFDPRLSASVAGAASSAARTFASITETKIAAVTVNPSVLNPFGVPPHPLTKSLVGLLNSADALRLGIEDLGSRGFSVDSSVLGALVDKHMAGLLTTADRAVLEAICQAGTSADSSSLPSLDLFDIAAQWLQTQVLEPMSIASFRKQIIDMITKYLCAYTRVVCLTLPLTEETKLLLTGHATQFEFACSQLMAAASKISSPGGSKQQAKALSSLGRPYRALRLMRPLLFMNTTELIGLVSAGESSPGSDILVADLADHIVCRLATAILDIGICTGAEVRPFLPYRIHQAKWASWVSSPESDAQLQKRHEVLAESLDHLVARIQVWLETHTDDALCELVSLVQAVQSKLLPSS
ncbi:Conserved oligomeric Golgi complex subunit [Coemansia sp. RSA 1933]|nr:Conserved oligomeric Golgi complex subunit [Coemansia sp. RSA 1933]